MPTTFRPHQPDQGLLLAPDLRDWLPEGHLAHHVSDLVEDLDLSAFCAPHEGDGRRKSPREPRMMVKVLIHGCATGVFSSRGLAGKLATDAGASGGLMTGIQPSHGVERGPIQTSLGCRAAIPRPKARNRLHEDGVPAAIGDSPGLISSYGASS